MATPRPPGGGARQEVKGEEGEPGSSPSLKAPALSGGHDVDWRPLYASSPPPSKTKSPPVSPPPRGSNVPARLCRGDRQGRVKGEINSLQCSALDGTLGLGGCVGRKDALGSTPWGQALGRSVQKGLQLQ